MTEKNKGENTLRESLKCDMCDGENFSFNEIKFEVDSLTCKDCCEVKFL